MEYFEYLQLIYQHLLRAEAAAPNAEIKGHLGKAEMALSKALDDAEEHAQAEQAAKDQA